MTDSQRYRVDQLLRFSCRVLKISPDSVLRHANLPATLLSDENKGATAQEYFAIWAAMEKCYGRQDFAEKIGPAAAHGPFVPAFFAFSCSPDIRKGIQRLGHFKPLVGPINFIAEDRADGFFIQIRPSQPGLRLPLTLAHAEAILLLELCRTNTATHITPLQVALPEPESANAESFGVAPTQSIYPHIALSLEDARLPLASENAEMWSAFEPDLRRQLAEKVADSGVRDRLRNALLEAIPSGETTIENLASHLHMSKRSLQRHLHDEGSSYQRVLDQTRTELARHYLEQTSVPLDEVSYLLGYANSASFYRAFQSWFGTTPASFRREQMAA